jgi:hypothetical protein
MPVIVFVVVPGINQSRLISVGMLTDWTSRVRFSTGAKDLFMLYNFQTSTGNPTAYSEMGAGESHPGIKWYFIEAATHLHVMPKSELTEIHLHSATCLHGLLLN